MIDVKDYHDSRRMCILRAMKNKQLILWHVVGWIMFLTYTHWEEYTTEKLIFEDYALIHSYDFVQIVVFYLFYGLIWKIVFRSKSTLWILISIPAGIFVFICTRYMIQEVLFPVLFGFDNYNDERSMGFYIQDNLIRGLWPTIASMVIFTVDHRLRPERDKLELQNNLKEAELSFLRSQINPHFLFNTLSFLHTKAFTKDEALAQAILKLSDVLRYSVDNSKHETRTTADEAKLLENYISIFKYRFGSKCYINFQADGVGIQDRIEPMLLLPFIENAFKHGVYHDPEDPIQVAINIKMDELHFTSQNRVNSGQKDPGSGVGLKNIKRRLELLYPNRHSLSIKEHNGYFHVDLKITL